MRLLQYQGDDGFSLVEYPNNQAPPYAILSHTWAIEDYNEVTFQDIVTGTGKNKPGYQKLLFCVKQAAEDDLRHVWVDTCCIDKSSHAEASEAINSMFRWYRNATKCYVYLSDVSVSESMGQERLSEELSPVFRDSRWFKRGWTLQELIAPESVNFFSVEGVRLGNKQSLEQMLVEITSIPLKVLQGSPLSQYSVKERVSWMRKRKTRKDEDIVYCLLGLLDVQMPLNYGEGRQKAQLRLGKEIRESNVLNLWKYGEPCLSRFSIDTTRYTSIPKDSNQDRATKSDSGVGMEESESDKSSKPNKKIKRDSDVLNNYNYGPNAVMGSIFNDKASQNNTFPSPSPSSSVGL